MIPTTSRRSAVYTGTGAVFVYAFGFKVFQDSDVQVVVTSTLGVESTLVLGTDYTVTRNADQTTFPGGSINLISALALSAKLVVIGATSYAQTTQLPTGGNYNATIVEAALDRIVMQVQQILELGTRTVRLPAAEVGPLVLPALATRASMFLACDASGNIIAANGVSSTAISVAMTPVVQAATVAAARTALGLTSAATAALAATNGFRLSLTTGLPVTTADVTAAGTIFAVPRTGNEIALYSGGAWAIYASAQFSLALAGLTVGRPYDVFCYANAGVPTLEFLAWASTTARATALAYQDGVLVKSGDATRRYLGSFHALTAATTEDSARRRLLWNYYHRVRRGLRVVEATASWNYTTATVRQANGNAVNQVETLTGVAEDDITVLCSGSAVNSTAGVTAITAIGIDSTVAAAGTCLQCRVDAPSAGNVFHMVARIEDVALLGYHVYAWLEYSGAAGVTTWSGSGTASSGMTGSVLA